MTIFVYSLFFVLFAYSTSAGPVPLNLSREEPKLIRTLFGIIWACLSTTVICAWTAVHPNIPPQSKWKARWNRVRLVFWMVVAPELVLAWAVRQFYGAREIRDTYNERHPELAKWKKWTLRHGHFFQMGGFRLVDPERKDVEPKEQKGTVLTFDYFRQNPNIDIPEITEEDIQDRSKGDVLFKLIAILQTSWFIIQCIARGQQRLALTELELVTLALASLNAVTFGIWWHKPLGVQEPVKIYWKIDANTEFEVEDDQRQINQNFGLSFRDVVHMGWKEVTEAGIAILDCLIHPCSKGLIVIIPIRGFFIISFPIFVLFPLVILLLLRVIRAKPVPQQTRHCRGLLAARIVLSFQSLRQSLGSTATKFIENWLEKIFVNPDNFYSFPFGWFVLLPLLSILLFFFTVFLTPFFVLLLFVSFVFAAVFGIVTKSAISPGASNVPSFYAPITESDRWSRMIVFALFGVTFGGLHCIGWNFQYPSHSEASLWRATSLAITVIPLIVAPIDLLLAAGDISSCQGFKRTAFLILDLIITVFLFIYVPVRLSLIVQAITLLRNQPSTAFVAVEWTKNVPHLFSY